MHEADPTVEHKSIGNRANATIATLPLECLDEMPRKCGMYSGQRIGNWCGQMWSFPDQPCIQILVSAQTREVLL